MNDTVKLVTPEKKTFEAFQKKFAALLDEYSFVVQPKLNVTPKGIMPEIQVFQKQKVEKEPEALTIGDDVTSADEKATN